MWNFSVESMSTGSGNNVTTNCHCFIDVSRQSGLPAGDMVKGSKFTFVADRSTTTDGKLWITESVDIWRELTPESIYSTQFCSFLGLPNIIAMESHNYTVVKRSFSGPFSIHF